MTKPDAKADAAPKGAASVAALPPSQVSEDGWVRADQLPAACAEYLNRDAPGAVHLVQMQAGMGDVRARWARGGEPSKPGDGIFRAGARMRFDQPDFPVQMDWPSGCVVMRCTSAIKGVSPITGQRTYDVQHRVVSIGPVEFFWPDLVALLPLKKAAKKSGGGKNGRLSGPVRAARAKIKADVQERWAFFPAGTDFARGFQAKMEGNFIALVEEQGRTISETSARDHVSEILKGVRETAPGSKLPKVKKGAS